MAGMMWDCRLRPRVSREAAYRIRWSGEIVEAGSPAS